MMCGVSAVLVGEQKMMVMSRQESVLRSADQAPRLSEILGVERDAYPYVDRT